MSGNLDTTTTAFIIALGTVAYGMEVDMLFTFWATAALRDPRKSPKKGFPDRRSGGCGRADRRRRWRFPGSAPPVEAAA